MPKSSELPSTLITKPGKSVSTIYRKQPKSFLQVGKSISYTSTGESFKQTLKPSYYQLAAWDESRKKEPYLKQGTQILALFLLNLVGTYSHPDPLIDKFIHANIDTEIKRWLHDLITPVLWSGNSCSEILKIRKLGLDGMPQVWLKDLVNYHPLNIDLVLDDFGTLNDGQKVTNSPYKSGVYVPMPEHRSPEYLKKRSAETMGSKIRLPKDKRVYLNLNGEGNNPYGSSILEAAYPYYLYKEAFRDLYFTALDRYGTPLVYFVVPHMVIEEYQDDEGNTIQKTYSDQIEEQVQDLSATNALVLTQRDPNNPVQVKALTTGNNFSDAFERAIALCDRNMLISLGIPNLLLEDKQANSLGSARASETQAEIFLALVSSIFDVIIPRFVDQVIHPLIKDNFDYKLNPLALEPGKFTKKPVRTTDLKVTTEAISELTDKGYLSSNDAQDRQYVRELLGLN